MGISLSVSTQRFRLVEPFRIAGYIFEDWEFVVVCLRDGDFLGRGEASGVYYLNDDVNHICSTIEIFRPLIEGGAGREEIHRLMPAGGARNAVDAALWELSAARAGVSAWRLAQVPSPKPLVTTLTVGAAPPLEMARVASDYVGARSLKLKLTGELEADAERVRAVRAARPDVWMAVDANQGYQIAQLDRLLEVLVKERVSLCEQPLARGAEADLDGHNSPIPLAADESVLTSADLQGLIGRFQVVNIKLDKCGGLTEGLVMARRARELGFGVMVGNMMGTSLGIAPAYLLAQFCDLVDLDGPIFLECDRSPSVEYRDGMIWCPEQVWGQGARPSHTGGVVGNNRAP